MARKVPVAGVPADGSGRTLTGNDGRSGDGPDTGLRRMLTWTFLALIVSLVMAYIGVTLAIRYFDKP